MSIHAVSGKPGGGKSLFAMKALVAELRASDRYIVTNLSVKLPELCDYLNRQYGHTFDAIQRIAILDEAQTAKFWLHRGNGVVLADEERNDFTAVNYSNWYHVPDESANVFYDLGTGPCRGYRRGGRGVVYIIDELHLFFNAREWAKTGKAALYYLSQHRKCGDDVIWVTQFVENVDKQFRSVTQDFTYLRNFKNEKLLSKFQSLPWFKYMTYQSPVNSASSVLTTPTESGRFLLDVKGLASCYDTAKGVGFAGGVAADTKKPRKGLPIWMAPVLFFVGLFVCYFLLTHGLSGMQHWFRSFSKPNLHKVLPTNSVSPAIAAESPEVAHETNKTLRTTYAKSLQQSGSRSLEDITSMTGYYKLGSVWFVMLSDGRVLRSDDVLFEKLAGDSVAYDGYVYRRALFVRATAPTSVVPPAPQNSSVRLPLPDSDHVTDRHVKVRWSDGSYTEHKLLPPTVKPVETSQ